MELQITVSLDYAAFIEDIDGEEFIAREAISDAISKTLRALPARADGYDYDRGLDWGIFDYNGNRVGKIEVAD